MLEARRNRLQSMCNGRFDVNKYSEPVIQLINDTDKVLACHTARSLCSLCSLSDGYFELNCFVKTNAINIFVIAIYQLSNCNKFYNYFW